MNHKLLLALPLLLAGCQTVGPTWSELTGEHYYSRTVQHRRAAIIERVDDQGAFAQYPIRVAPGKHVIEVQGPVRRPGGGDLRMLTIDMEPCKRYYVNTQFKNNLEREFEPVIDYVETIAGCRVG